MAVASYPACEVLFELFSAPRGKVLLGRVATGREAGRVVRLRLVGDSVPLRLNDIVGKASTLTHPDIVKLLGIVCDGSHYYLASEYLPGISLFELIARARARQQGFELAAAVHVTYTALRLVEQAAALLDALSLPRRRLFYTDSIWIAEFGETLLAEPGLASELGARGDDESGVRAVQGDIVTAAVELYHLATGKLLTHDLTAAVEQALPDPLAHTLTEVFSWSDTEAADTVSSFARALGRLPAELRGDDAGVARALRLLAADVLSEREEKLAEYRPDMGPAIDGPTRVYALPDPDAAPDEPTVVFARQLIARRPALGARPVASGQPKRALVRAAQKPGPDLVSREMPVEPAAPHEAPTSARKTASRGFVFVALGLFAVLVLGFVARTHPAWVRALAARVKLRR